MRKLLGKTVLVGLTVALNTGCVMEPYPPPQAPVAVVPVAPYGCCYSYYEYPPYYYGLYYGGPEVGFVYGAGRYGGGRGGWRGR